MCAGLTPIDMLLVELIKKLVSKWILYVIANRKYK